MSPTPHPQRYPKHDDPLKGQVYRGECNRTACTNHEAIFWNVWTHGFYCLEDAIAINRGKSPLCIPMKRNLTIEEMDNLQKAAAQR